jgi:hypothetical protein
MADALVGYVGELVDPPAPRPLVRLHTQVEADAVA